MNLKQSILVAVCALFCANALAAVPTAGRKRVPDPKYAEFQNPADRYRPFVRWWWNGDRVEAEELVRELHLLKEAGIGGVEINPISFPGGDNTAGTKELIWLSDEWIEMLNLVFIEAEKIGMTCDLIIGSGWPFGSESLKRSETACVMLTYCEKVKGGLPFEMSKFHIFKALDPGVSIVNPRREPELISMYLVPDPINDLSEAIDIMPRFEGDVVRMDIPEGNWQIYAMARYDSFASVINGAPGAAGSILNHMDAVAVRNYLDHMADTIEAKIGPLNRHLRAFFVDSMELEGSNWTYDFASEFKARRGYDILPWLPFTMFKVGRLGDVEKFEYGCAKGEKFQEQVNRVRFDFELTKAELLHERYTATFLQWCRDKGVKSRAQAYGRGFFPLESSLGYDIPEGESWTTNWLRHVIGAEMGDEDYRRGRGYTMIDKYVSSAAHLTGKRLVSAEEMTNTYNVFSTSLEYLKVGSDMSAISGITHSIWHGFNYNPPKAGFPGWVQYGSYYNEKNTWWPYFKKLNDYRARMSTLLQNADMFTDICILPANYDMWSTMGVQTEPFPVKLNVPYTSLIWEAIHKNGGGADYVSEIILRDSEIRGGKICYGPKEYGTIFLPEVRSTYPETMAKLLEFVRQGGRVFCVECVPEKSLGLLDYERRDEEIRAAVQELKKYPDNFILLPKPSDGKFLEWYTGIMNRYGLPHTIEISNPDRFLLQNRYVTDEGSDIFLFVNAHMTEARSTRISFPASVTRGKNAWIYDPETGKRHVMPIGADGGIDFEFGPSESYLFVFNRQKGGEKWNVKPLSGSEVTRLESWDVVLHNPQSDSTWTVRMDGLKDLKDMPEFKYFMGTATYTAKFNLSGKMPRYINLGKVHEICELRVNGKELGTDWFGNRVYDLGGVLREGENVIEVKVTTLMSNYLQSMPDNKVVQRYILRRKTPFKPAGLVGPVELY